MRNECIFCGAEVPEGRQVCPICEKKCEGMSSAEQERLRCRIERLELLLFAVVRNSAVYPIGRRLGKSEREISRKTLETIKETEKIVDFDRMKELMALGKSEVNDEHNKENI